MHVLFSQFLNGLWVKQNFPPMHSLINEWAPHVLQIRAPNPELFTLYLICLTSAMLYDVHIVRKCSNDRGHYANQEYFGYN